jgi:hypothetical protein
MTDIDGLHCTWDFKDRLVEVEDDKMRAEYRYDYTDRRVIKRVWPKAGADVPPSTLNATPAPSTPAEGIVSSGRSANSNP